MLALRLTREVHETRLSVWQEEHTQFNCKIFITSLLFLQGHDCSTTESYNWFFTFNMWWNLAEVLENCSGFLLALEMSNLGSMGSQELNEAWKQQWPRNNIYSC